MEETINGIKQSDARRYLNELAKNLLGKPVGSVTNAIRTLFRDAKTYGFNFYYGTNEGLFETLQHSEDDCSIVVGVVIEKIKNNKI